MRGAWVIAGKDLRNIFLSPLFYVISGVCSLIWFLMFVTRLSEFITQSTLQMIQGQGTDGIPLHFFLFYPHLSMVNLIMIFAVSAITMRLFTEEKRNRTFDLLLTAPVTSTEIVVGKLIAGVLTAWALLAIAAVYPLSLAFFANLDWGPLFSAFLGVFLLTAGYVAVGIFSSSLTQSAVISIILSLILSVMLWFVGALADRASSATEKDIVQHLSVGEHLQNFMKGNMSIAGFVFFLSLIFIFAFLTRQVVESNRWR
jgi:ABC-2 type transport system permease protein